MVNKQHCSVSLLQPPVLIRPGAFCFLLMKQVLLSRVTYSPVNKCISSFTALPGMCSSDFGKTVVPSWQMLHWHRVFLLLPFFPWGKNSTNFTSLLYLSALIAFLERMIWRCEFSFRCTHRHCHCHCHVPVFRLHSGSLRGSASTVTLRPVKPPLTAVSIFLSSFYSSRLLTHEWFPLFFLLSSLPVCLFVVVLPWSTPHPSVTPSAFFYLSTSPFSLSFSSIYLSLSPSHSLLSIFHSPPLILPLLHTLLVLFPKSPKSRGSKHKSRRKSKKLREPSTVCSPFLQCHVGGGGEERGGDLYIFCIYLSMSFAPHACWTELLTHSALSSFNTFYNIIWWLSFLPVIFCLSYYKRKYGNASLYFFFFFSLP